MDGSTLDFGLADLARQVRGGHLSAERAMRDRLDRIAARDGDIRAFIHLDPEAALACARAIDRGDRQGSLAGVPFAVKDIIDTADAPTAYGSQAYVGHRPAADASCVALMRAAGAVMIGKTVSTEFAMFSPGATRNPFNLGHTPGGSSSGSAAAVAAGMAPVAFGTQTSGSVIRPAAFCGIVGYKPSFGWIDRTGIKPLAETLDTVGLMARSVADIATVAEVLARRPLGLPETPALAGTIGLLRPRQWGDIDGEAEAVLMGAVERLRGQGLAVTDHAGPAWLDELPDLHATVMAWEVTRSLAHERHFLSARIAPRTLASLTDAAATTTEAYDAAAARAATLRAEAEALFGAFDLLLVPAAPGAAPEGLERTGDPAFNRPWTLLGGPALTMRAGFSSKGLPIGLQLVGRRGADAMLLRTAQAVERALAPTADCQNVAV